MPQRFMDRARPGAIECRVAPASVDERARTAEVVWTTGARVLRRSFRGDFLEELEVSPAAVRLERLNSGNAPLLDTHDTWDLDSVIGVVERASVKAGEGRAVVKFSDRSDRARQAFEGVREGVVRNVSVGYLVHRAEETDGDADGLPVRRATDWEPVELSFVPVGADAGAGVRAAERAQSNDCIVIRSKDANMRHRLTDEEFRIATEALTPASRATLLKIATGQGCTAAESEALAHDMRQTGAGGGDYCDAGPRRQAAREMWRRTMRRAGRLNEEAAAKQDILAKARQPGATSLDKWKAAAVRAGIPLKKEPRL